MHIRKEFYRYVLPSMLAFALSGVYAIADGFFVGNALGDDALAAINVAFPLTAFLQAVGTGIGMGGAVEYAISMGSGGGGGTEAAVTGNTRQRGNITVESGDVTVNGISFLRHVHICPHGGETGVPQ